MKRCRLQVRRATCLGFWVGVGVWGVDWVARSSNVPAMEMDGKQIDTERICSPTLSEKISGT